MSVLELPARWGASDVALAEVDALLAAGPPTDLVLLPEAALTGYVSPAGDFDLTRFAEPLDGPTAARLAALAARHRVHLIAPLVEADEGRCHNALIGFAPDGARVLHYRKRHPWYPEEWATPGELPHPLVELGGLRVTAAICFDLHFLDDDAAEALGRADLLLFASAWVEEVDSRPAALAALARRHGVAVANANWGPGAPRIPGQGGSRLVAADGTTLAVVPSGARRADAVIGPRQSG